LLVLEAALGQDEMSSRERATRRALNLGFFTRFWLASRGGTGHCVLLRAALRSVSFKEHHRETGHLFVHRGNGVDWLVC
jgi:hypothetical protein